MKSARIAVVALVVAITMNGCTLQGDFRLDERLQIMAPGDRQTVTLPLRVRWRFDNESEAARFGVFIDRAPVRVGENIDALARNDRDCTSRPGCPDESWFQAQGVFVTTKAGLRIDTLGIPFDARGARELHQLTIVILDAQARRVGETAASVEFFFEREQI